MRKIWAEMVVIFQENAKIFAQLTLAEELQLLQGNIEKT